MFASCDICQRLCQWVTDLGFTSLHKPQLWLDCFLFVKFVAQKVIVLNFVCIHTFHVKDQQIMFFSRVQNLCVQLCMRSDNHDWHLMSSWLTGELFCFLELLAIDGTVGIWTSLVELNVCFTVLQLGCLHFNFLYCHHTTSCFEIIFIIYVLQLK